MKRPLTAVVLAALLPAAFSSPTNAWVPDTRVRMVDEAIRLMPRSLRVALESHREAVLRGVLEPQRGEDGPEHRPSWAGGGLESEVAARALALVRAVEEPAPFATVAKRFGELAHFVMDAGFPPGASELDSGARYNHFATFCEARREKFPLVFYGHSGAAVERGDFEAFAREMLERSRAEDRILARAYAAAGWPPHPAAFDDRSVPFAVGSLAYSRTVTDLVSAWLAAWAEAWGDLGRTPYLDRAVRERLERRR
jgi:hypothetical protein